MTELKRLLDADATEVERQLLRAGGAEQPDSKMIQRAAAALGVSASVVTVAQVSVAGTQAAAAAGKAAAVAVPLGFGKWLAVAGMLGAASYGTYQVMREPARAPSVVRPAPVVAPAPVAPAPVAVPPAAAEVTPSTEPARSAEARPSAHAEPQAGYSSVADEVKAIARARAAVGRGDAKAALAELDSYDRRFASGALRQEATLLRVQALELKGDRKAAQALGERFIQANPNSPHQERVRGLLSGAAGTGAKSGAH